MSTAVCSTSLGKVEIALRIISIVLCMGIVASAAIALSAILSIEDVTDEYEDIDLYKSGAAWLIFAAGVGLIAESIITILRLLGAISDENITVFGIVDVVISSVLAVSLLAGGVANAKYASDNADNYDDIEQFCELDGLNSQAEDFCNDVKKLRDSEIAAAVLSFVGMVAFGVLALIMIVTYAAKRGGK
ncbi:uncharacterized protein [Dysidea avara]|uniref:uncharacterized protein isoform X1 n=2 Tax=Dysidea avara TaxID=196820 RepID=UPI00332714A7